MTTNDIEAAALVLDQTYFALDAQGFAMFQDLVDNPPSATAGLPCRGRLNFDPPCRLNFDPGMGAGVVAAGCG